MRRSVVFHILLLCQCWTWAHSEADSEAAQTVAQGLQAEIQGVEINQAESTRETNDTVDLWAELKELRDMTIELKTDLKHYLSRIEVLEEEKLGLEVKISSIEKEMEGIKRENAELENTLNIVKSEVEALKSKNMALEARMTTNEKEVEEIRREYEDQPKVVFSTALTSGYFGPFNTDVTLKFSKVFINFGQGYNPSTGFFTAPVKGIYYFRYTLLEKRKDMSLGIHLFHNGKHVMGSFEVSDGSHESISNAIILQLEQGDEVYMNLLSNHGLYDDGNNYTTFSGFLLFPL
ncbi:heavy metal-binding protein HIP-like [Xiphophorus maculatus]|uniref:Cerebellin 17 n=1 Tax=Xiphophorus maculatus TaxID=8083 RepID=A0A3B5QPS4_XIPMA|nr:heavy metal-binding protein HIP-like [Xiphophorus maculatus]